MVIRSGSCQKALEEVSTTEISVTVRLESNHKTLERISTAKILKWQVFGGIQYSKNISDSMIRIKPQGFGGVRTAILSELIYKW